MKPAILLLLLASSTPLFAADPSERWRLSVLRINHGYGLTVAYAPAPEWDVELGAGQRPFDEVITIFIPQLDGSAPRPVTTYTRYKLHPIDFFVTRRFVPEARLSPYVRLGARYLEAPPDPDLPFVPNVLPLFRIHYSNRTSAQAGAGLRLRLTPRTALRVEGARLLRSKASAFDPLNRVAAGLSWHF